VAGVLGSDINQLDVKVVIGEVEGLGRKGGLYARDK
jgi:hypothetical protein